MRSPGTAVHAGHRRRRGRPVAGKSADCRGRRRTREHARRPVHAARSATSRPRRRCRSSARFRRHCPSDPEGVGAFPSAGPYVVTEYRPGERVMIRRNRFYSGTRPHHVDGFDIDLAGLGPQDMLDRVERGEADWGHAPCAELLRPGRATRRRSTASTRSQFFVRPGLGLQAARLQHRPTALPRQRAAETSGQLRDRPPRARASRDRHPLADRLTDQYLPPSLPGFRDADIYPLERPDLERARALARGNLRGGKAVLYSINGPSAARGRAGRQAAARARSGSMSRCGGCPVSALLQPGSRARRALGHRAPPLGLRTTSIPFTYINGLFDRRFAGGDEHRAVRLDARTTR